MQRFLGHRTVDAIDWGEWQAVDLATLLFVQLHDRLLLIRKKRGLGAGKINGPGGRVEPGESLVECAVRETREELGITALEPHWAGVNRFQFVDGHSIHVHVYRAHEFAGEPRETAEAIPLWTPLDRIPYDEMWEDDRLWLPLMLAGRPFDGRFVFEGDRMLDHRIETDVSFVAGSGAVDILRR